MANVPILAPSPTFGDPPMSLDGIHLSDNGVWRVRMSWYVDRETYSVVVPV